MVQCAWFRRVQGSTGARCAPGVAPEREAAALLLGAARCQQGTGTLSKRWRQNPHHQPHHPHPHHPPNPSPRTAAAHHHHSPHPLALRQSVRPSHPHPVRKGRQRARAPHKLASGAQRGARAGAPLHHAQRTNGAWRAPRGAYLGISLQRAWGHPHTQIQSKYKITTKSNVCSNNWSKSISSDLIFG